MSDLITRAVTCPRPFPIHTGKRCRLCGVRVDPKDEIVHDPNCLLSRLSRAENPAQ